MNIFTSYMESKQRAVQILTKALPDIKNLKPFIDKLVSADPSNTFKFTEIFANIIANSPERWGTLGEFMAKVDNAEFKERLKTFNDKRYPIDVNKIKTLSDLESILHESETKITKSKTKVGLRGLKKGYDYLEIPKEVLNQPGVNAYIPLNYEASKIIASSRVGSCEGKWCTAYAKSRNYWNDYIQAEKGLLVYVIDDDAKIETNKKVAILLLQNKKDADFWDAQDNQIDDIQVGDSIKTYVWNHWDEIRNKIHKFKPSMPKYLFLINFGLREKHIKGLRITKNLQQSISKLKDFLENQHIQTMLAHIPLRTTEQFNNERMIIEESEMLFAIKFESEQIPYYNDISILEPPEDKDDLWRYKRSDFYMPKKAIKTIYVNKRIITMGHISEEELQKYNFDIEIIGK